MSSWLGGSLSTLTGQLSNLTKDILTEGTEEVSDPTTELRLAREKLQHLDSLLSTQRQENDRLKRITRELEEKAEGSELQINTISREYRAVLEGKEKEVNTLKHQNQELLEQQARAAAVSTPAAQTHHNTDNSKDGWDSFNFDGDHGDWDFDDSIRLQRENNSLRLDLQHWKSVAAQLGQNVGQTNQSHADGADLFDLQHKVKSLEAKLQEKGEELQQQAASLHEHHRHKMAALKARHQGEVTNLQSEVASLEQRLADARDGTSGSQHSGSTNLPEAERATTDDTSRLEKRLEAALRDKKKAEDGRAHLESTLEELQTEVQDLQARNEALQQEMERRVQELSTSLQESEGLQQELSEVRRELQKQASQSLQDVQKEQQEALANAENALEKLGDGDGPKNLSKELLRSLERENLSLQEETVRLKEQQVLLEKAASSASAQRSALQRKVTALRARLRTFTDEDEAGDSDDTLEAEFTSESASVQSSSNTSQNAALRITQEEVEEELQSLRAQLKQQTSDLADAEMERADWGMEREALEEVVTELRAKAQQQEREITSLKSGSNSSKSLNEVEPAEEKSPSSSSGNNQLAGLEAELASLREDKAELEAALEELDAQHNQALEQLISQRDGLSARLAECDAQLTAQQAQVEQLTQLVAQLKEEAAAAPKAKEDESTSSSSLSAKDAEIADLKEKLQKGGLVINDLHMDKQELEEALGRAREETALKVAKLKELREENSRLEGKVKAAEGKVKAAEGKLEEMEEELEQWERRNEERQVEQMSSAVEEREECVRLKARVHALEREKESFAQTLLSGFGEGGAGGKEMSAEMVSSVEDPALRSVLEGEVRVRRQMEEDHRLIGELRQQVQKLYDNKQVLKKELADLQAFKEATIEKLMNVEGELEDARSRLGSVTAEKDGLAEKVAEKERTAAELRSELSGLELEKSKADDQCEKLAEEMKSQQKHFDAYVQELKQLQEMSAESLHEEHQQLLVSQRELNLELDRLKAEVKEKSGLETALAEKTQENTELASKTATLAEELTLVRAEISRLESVCEEKDSVVTDLQQRMSRFDTDLDEMEESISAAEEKHRQEVEDKERCLEEVTTHKDRLERSLSQVSLELEEAVQTRQQLERSLSSQELDSLAAATSANQPPTQGVSSQGSLQAQGDGAESLSQLDEAALRERASKLETELLLRDSVIEGLEGELKSAQDMVRRQEVGIADLNEKTAESRQLLDRAQEQVSRQQSTIAVMRQASRNKEVLLEEIQTKLSILAPTLTEQQVQKLQNYAGATAVPALEYQDVKAIEFNKSESAVLEKETNDKKTAAAYADREGDSLIIKDLTDSGTSVEDDIDNGVSEHERSALLEREMDTLRERLQEKDVVVTELQRSNSSLLSLLEKGSGGQSLADQVAGHKLEAEVRGLKAEKEQMVAVMTEKSRENSSLKSEMHRLMEVVAAGQSALAKLQEDNQSVQQQQTTRQQSPPRGDDDDDDMRREALANMARLVRDRETEIEALTQKNQTLLAVLQEGGGGSGDTPQGSSGSGSHVASLLQEKDQLSQQVATMASEREQLVACITQKHSEAVAYHGEAQRLSAVLAQAQAVREKTEADYAALALTFEDKSQALVSVQSELVQCKQKLSDLEVRHGELIQRSNSLQDSAGSGGGKVPSPELASLEEELTRLRSSELQLSTSLSQREEKVHALSQRVSALEEGLTQKETECAHLRKQVENAKFQLTGLMSEIADVRAERDGLQQRMSNNDSESSSLREQFSQLTTACRDKDTELSAMREQVSTLTSLLEQGAQTGGGGGGAGAGSEADQEGQLARLVRENEGLAAQALQLQQEKGHQVALAEHTVRQCQQLQAEIAHWKEKEFKLNKELQRLREHLIEIEDGYTKEALESEEREKNLRNRLAVVEEQLSSSLSQIELASLESSRHVETLQAQLQHACAQRDSAYSQVASGMEQTRQLQQSLANLQLVLEQFQREKDSTVAAETERLELVCAKLKEQVAVQKKELEDTRADLADALEGLEAANRLSEQLDRKEEALAALKEEVLLREQALHAAEEEIRKLNSSTEAKVDKMLVHNMVMTWLTSPESKRPEIVHLIGNILSFSSEDFRKIEAAQNPGGLLSGIFRRPSSSSTPQSTPTKSAGNSSFSQLFVSFLERESSPPPTPVRLPAEAMAAEANQHRQQRPPPTFNPFTAPRHVTHDVAGSGGGNRFAEGLFAGGGGRNPGPASSSSSQHQHHPLMSAADSSMIPSSALFTPVFSTSAARSTESAILKDVLGDSR